MNITKYYSKEDKNPPIYRGRATLQKGYTVVDADESFYRYIGTNSARPFPKLVHPDDAECVTDALAILDEGPQRLIFRLLCGDGSYRYMYGVFEYNGREQDGFRYVDLSLLDIMRIHHRYDSDFVKLTKYRKFMSLSDELYFEYGFESDCLIIFEYFNNRAVQRYKDTLSNLQASVAESDKFTFKQKAEFESFSEYLKNSAETMKLEVDGEVFGLDCGYMHMQGGLVYVDNKKELMAGTITVMGDLKKDDKYYMGAHAFDTATNVYNKRAIKEIAMELVANAGDNKILLSVMDIDDFKNINDTYGHMKGDEVIAKVAEIIHTTLGNRGYVGRFGGDEFMVVTDKVADAKNFGEIFTIIRKNIMWSCGELLPDMTVTLSLGVATYPDHASNYEELFKVADKCLYIAKAKGKNRLIKYTPEMHANFEMSAETADKRMPMNFEQSCAAVVGMLNGFGKDDPERFETSIQEFLRNYNLDRVLICAGNEYQKEYVVYHPELSEDEHSVVENMAFWKQDSASDLFDKKGVLVRNNVLPFEDTHPDVYEALSGQGTDNFVAVKVKPTDGPEMLVFFDMIKKHRKWSSREEALLYISAWTIAQRYLVMMSEIKN